MRWRIIPFRIGFLVVASASFGTAAQEGEAFSLGCVMGRGPWGCTARMGSLPTVLTQPSDSTLVTWPAGFVSSAVVVVVCKGGRLRLFGGGCWWVVPRNAGLGASGQGDWTILGRN